MKDHLLMLAAAQPDPRLRLNLVREYLQAHILRSIEAAGGFASLAFVGGTALRFFYGLRRFSEDLDFSLERPEHDRGLERLGEIARRDLEQAGYDVEATFRTARTVHKADLKFSGLLHEVDRTIDQRKKMMVRIEVDTNPPAGAVIDSRMTTRHFPISLRVYDLGSCLAGKVHALLCRGHTKGRDLYDLAWYLTQRPAPSPNFVLLRNALEQSGWQGPEAGPGNWMALLVERVASMDWAPVLPDVRSFLQDPRDRLLLDKEMLLGELSR